MAHGRREETCGVRNELAGLGYDDTRKKLMEVSGSLEVLSERRRNNLAVSDETISFLLFYKCKGEEVEYGISGEIGRNDVEIGDNKPGAKRQRAERSDNHFDARREIWEHKAITCSFLTVIDNLYINIEEQIFSGRAPVRT